MFDVRWPLDEIVEAVIDLAKKKDVQIRSLGGRVIGSPDLFHPQDVWTVRVCQHFRSGSFSMNPKFPVGS